MSQTSTEYTIVVRGKNGMSTEHVLPVGRSVFLGSSSDCGIQIDNNEVANLHCLLDVGEDGLSIQDWASSTGTIVNGKAIDGKVTLSSDDSIVVGSAVISVRNGSQSSSTERPLPQEEYVDPNPPKVDSADETADESPGLSDNSSVVDALAKIQAMIGEFKDGAEQQSVDPVADFIEPVESFEEEFDADIESEETHETLELPPVSVEDESEIEMELVDAEPVDEFSANDSNSIAEHQNDFAVEAFDEAHSVDLGSVDLIVIEHADHTPAIQTEETPAEIDDEFDPEFFYDESYDDTESNPESDQPLVAEFAETKEPKSEPPEQVADSWDETTEISETTGEQAPSPSSSWAEAVTPSPAPVAMSGWNDCEQDDSLFGEVTYDQETVDLLKAEIDDLRSLLAERNAQIEHLSHEPAQFSSGNEATDDQTEGLVKRIDELIQETTEHEAKMATVMDLLEAAEFKNDTEVSERQALESWLSEVEKRMSQTRDEWRSELDARQQRLDETIQQRDHAQQQLRQVAARYESGDAQQESLDAQQEMLDELQKRNRELEEQAEKYRKECANLRQQVENTSESESDDLQEQRALIAKERADVSRMRFELSQKLSEFENANANLNEFTTPVDREVALRLQTLRSHLREIHEQERLEREERGESLISRISNLWKRADEY